MSHPIAGVSFIGVFIASGWVGWVRFVLCQRACESRWSASSSPVCRAFPIDLFPEDGTVRYLLRLDDAKTIESVFIPEKKRDTLCISTQVGCPVDCKFCLTALMGLERNLSAGEIAGQVLRLFAEHQLEPRTRPVNIVMMGMGEPLLNLDAVLKATRLLADPEGIGVTLRRITVSTSGITPKILEMAQYADRPHLAVSLNASTEETRQKLMPVTSKYHLDELLEACGQYPLRLRERLTFEYVLLKDVNDTDADARRVARLLANLKCRGQFDCVQSGTGDSL